MSELYIAQNSPMMCTKGRRLIGIAVNSQSTVFLKNGGSLMATENDRFKDNFICPEMMVAGGILGGGLMAALGGGIFAIALAGFAGSAMIDDMLNICSFLCKGSDWKSTHSKVKIEGKKPLLQHSNLKCFIGGKVTFFLPNPAIIKEYLTASKMAQDSYNDYPSENAETKIDDYTRVDTNNQEALDKILQDLNNNRTCGPMPNMQLSPQDFDTNSQNGFYAALYEDEKGNYFVAFRGSEPKGMQFYHDWAVEDGGQAFGVHTPQIEASRNLADKMNQLTCGNTSFTGHSLGGGNSAIAGLTTGAKSYTFNARGLHQNTIDYLNENGATGSAENIMNYSTSNDILNALQNNREGLLSTIATSPIGGLGRLLNAVGIRGIVTGAVPRVTGDQHEIYGYSENNEGMSLKMIGDGHSAYNDALSAMMSTINLDVVANSK